jgi:T5orf172 domain
MIVCVLTNPAMPGLVKIGQTSFDEPQNRIAQLYSTGVPVPFKIEFACKVADEREVEKALHIAFGPSRINPKREFFRIEPEQAIAILRLLHTEDKTAEIAAQNAEIDAESVQAAESLRARRPNFNFEEMQIPFGSVLNSYDDDSSATVIAPKKVRYSDEEMTLTAATRLMLGLDYNVAPGPHWTFNGKRVSAIYEETYPED